MSFQEFYLNWIDDRISYKNMFVIGRLLKFEDNTVLLVGHVNNLSGICDDCTERRTIIGFSDVLIPIVKQLVGVEENA